MEIELLLGTVNHAIVSAPMELYQVADKLWQKCLELSVMISEMPWHEVNLSLLARANNHGNTYKYTHI